LLASVCLAAPVATVAAEQKVTTGRKRVLVLIDRSASIQSDANQAFERIVEQINKMGGYGDELGIGFIHGKTTANAQIFRIEARRPADYADMGGLDQDEADTDFENQVRQQRRRMKDALRKSLTVAASDKIVQWSDVWGSLATMDTFFRSAGLSDNCQVFIVSDLVESMPGAGRRDFHKQHPANDAAQLRQMARADVPKIRSIYGLGSASPLSKVDQFTVLFPASGVQNSQNNAMTQYWTNVFELLGLSRSKMLFQ
jgi:hypothetical protein